MTVFESRQVSLDDFPREQAAALRRIHEHVGGNLCIQLSYRNDENRNKPDAGAVVDTSASKERGYIHVYFSVNDPSMVQVPEGLDETKDIITLHFNRTPKSLHYRRFTTAGGMCFPQGVSSVQLSDCRIGGSIMLGHGTLLTMDWTEIPPRPVLVLSC